jgi:hypothetical protein
MFWGGDASATPLQRYKKAVIQASQNANLNHLDEGTERLSSRLKRFFGLNHHGRFGSPQ